MYTLPIYRITMLARLSSLVLLLLIAPRLGAQAPTDSSPRAIPTERRQTLDTIRVTQRAGPQSTGYRALRSRTATRSETSLRDVPHAVAIVTGPAMRDQAMRGLADAVRYLPGVGMAQGEGNRDAPVLRGNTSTGDLFVDGVRDDAQYFRDLYNVERVEAIKGANAMIFGRGGAGGILNRVTRQPTGESTRELTVQGGASNERRISADLGDALTPTWAARVSAVLEQDDSFRAGVSARREGVTPAIAWRAGTRTTWRLSAEHYRDDRTADRGVPSMSGRPVDLDAFNSVFFGDPAASRSRVTAHIATVALSHGWPSGIQLESRVRVADYDKAYRNVYAAGPVDVGTQTLALAAYENATRRQNLFWQTDLSIVRSTGPIIHRLLAGVELGRQATDNLRQTGYFGGTGLALTVPLAAPTTVAVLTWRPSATDASNSGVAQLAAAYVQDQMRVTDWLQVVAGVRVDRFHLDVTNRRAGTELASRDAPISPRLGVIASPTASLAVYGSWSTGFVPRGGDQLGSLSPTNQALAPEQFRNTEIGAKWDVTEAFSATIAGYRLSRSNVVVPDPLDATRTVLASAQHTDGIEVGVAGVLRAGWQVMGGYAYQDGRFTQAVSATVPAGARVANLPRHTLSLWQRVDVNNALGFGLGLQRHAGMVASSDNLVSLPGFTRVDVALFARIDATWSVQANLENLLDERHIVSANGNNNLQPGTPRLLRVVLRASR